VKIVIAASQVIAPSITPNMRQKKQVFAKWRQALSQVYSPASRFRETLSKI